MENESQVEAGKHELVLTRVFDAPRELVFRAWIEEEQLAQWWGPQMFTNPVCRLDVRPGGSITIDMRAPDGTVYPMKGTFHQVVEPEVIIFTSSALEDEEGRPGLEVLNTVRFFEQGGKTRLTLHARVVRATPEAAEALAGMEEGWRQSLDKLERLLSD